MAYNKYYKKGGMGGKLGRSNMTHGNYSATAKLHSRRIRRMEEKQLLQQETQIIPEIPDELADVHIPPPVKKKKQRTRTRQTYSDSFMTEEKVKEYIYMFSGAKLKFKFTKELSFIRLLLKQCNKTDLIKSKFSKVFDRPLARDLLKFSNDKKKGDRLITSLLYDNSEDFVISLGKWGTTGNSLDDSWDQTSRPGMNLVLQLNFSNKHDLEYRKLICKDDTELFQYSCHPIAKNGRMTMAWARIDIDDSLEYALIEEIQSDWLRSAMNMKDYFLDDDGEEPEGNPCKRYLDTVLYKKKLDRYLDKVISPYLKIWDEAVMMAAISFLAECMGIRTIYYHTFDSIRAINDFDDDYHPPMSLYGKLPKRFCFERVKEFPPFLKDRLDFMIKEERIDKYSDLEFFKLEF